MDGDGGVCWIVVGEINVVIFRVISREARIRFVVDFAVREREMPQERGYT
jgi:hypothetical protein